MPDDELLGALGRALHEPETDGPHPERIDMVRRAAARARSNASAPPVSRLPSTWRPGGSGVRRLVSAAAASTIGLVGLAVGLALGDDGTDGEDPAVEDIAEHGTVEFEGSVQTGSGATADLSVVATGIGRVVRLRTEALEILPTGEYYEVWFVGPGDRPGDPDRISAGTFHPDDEGNTDVVLAAAVDPELYPVVEVTSEPGDGDPGVSGPVVLEAEIGR